MPEFPSPRLRRAPGHVAARGLVAGDAARARLGTLLAVVLAAAVRLPGLDRLSYLVFDETYYVKDAYSLWALGYEGTWAEGSDGAFAAGDFSGLSPAGSFVVHPPLGKWLIGLGMRLTGPSDPVGWRLATCAAGIAVVWAVCRLAWALFGSAVVATLAGCFVALDGIAVVMSRTGLLDGILAFFVVVGFLALCRALGPAGLRASPPRAPGASAGTAVLPIDEVAAADTRVCAVRPAWLVAAGVAWGCACAVKWSGAYVLAGGGLFTAAWIVSRWRRSGRGDWAHRSARDVAVAFVSLVPTALVVYVASWAGWMAHMSAWGRSRQGFVGALADLWEYHLRILHFHSTLEAEHPYSSSPLSWLVQAEPTLFAWDHVAGDSGRIAVVDALGNPALWWAAVPALIAVVVHTMRRRDWATGTLLLGYAVTYVPWLAFTDRTVFTFYTVVLVPFVALALAWAVNRARVRATLESDGHLGVDAVFICLAIIPVVAVFAAAVYFLPFWTACPVPEDWWSARMWLPSW